MKRKTRAFVVSLCVGLVFALPLRAGGLQAPVVQTPPASVSTPVISGRVLPRFGNTGISGIRLRLRLVDTGTIVAQTVSDSTGAYAFSVSMPGLYVVEAVDDDGGVLAVSEPVTVTTMPVPVDVILPARRAAILSTPTWLIIAAVATGAGVAAFGVGGDGGLPPVSPEQ